MQDKTIKCKGTYGLVVFCLTLIFNPNIMIIDILPDFLAYFILARVFLKPSDAAPYFTEARDSFHKLAWLNLAKIPAIILVSGIRSQNAADNDVIALSTLVFAVFECVLMIQAIGHIFEAFFRLGQRTELSSAIAPFKISKRRTMKPEALKKLTYLFAILKCFTYFFPNIYLLTRTLPNGAEIHISSAYPITLLACLLVGLVVGIIWLRRMIKYAKAIKAQNYFNEALISLISTDPGFDFDAKIKARKMSSALGFLTLAAVFTIDLSFTDLYEINLLPHFLFGALLIFAIAKLLPFGDVPKRLLIFPSLYTVISLGAYVFETRFLLDYGYEALLTETAAREAYKIVQSLSYVEFALLAISFVSLFVVLRGFVFTNLGVPKTSDKYGPMEKEYHRGLSKKTGILCGLGILCGAIQLVAVIVRGTVKVIYTDPDDVTMPVVISPSIAWIGLLVTAMAIAYIGYTVYYVSTMKDELSLNSSRY